MKVHWTDTAREHLDTIHAHFAQNSPAYARRLVDRLTRRSQQIAVFPLSGRRVPEMDVDQIREVFEGPYRIVYFIKPDQIEVLAKLRLKLASSHRQRAATKTCLKRQEFVPARCLAVIHGSRNVLKD